MDLTKLGSIRGARQPVSVAQQPALRSEPLWDDASFGRVIEPADLGTDPLAWLASNRETIDLWLLEHRALLFRGFPLASSADFEAVVSATSAGGRMVCPDESTPRAALGDRIYESTVYPAHKSIRQHNEASYCDVWPLKIFFACLHPARTGGATPLTDNRKVLERIRPQTLDQFRELGVAYTRNFTDRRIGLRWQQAFWTQQPSEVEEYCRLHQMQFQWLPAGGLRTTAARPAFRRHPSSGESLWFNHAIFFHEAAYLREIREALISSLGRDHLPYASSFGDGSPIDDEIVSEFLYAFEAEKRSFVWQRGDVLLLDNMTVAHGREPFEGDRTVIVAMTEAQND